MEAFLIIDMQKTFVDFKKSSEDFDRVIEYINFTASLFRDKGKPVIVIRDISEGDGIEFDLIHEIATDEHTYEILKLHNNSFWETELDELLNELNVELTVLSGYAAEYCVSATYFGALERGYNAVILQNGVLSDTEEGIASLRKNKPAISYQALEYILTMDED